MTAILNNQQFSQRLVSVHTPAMQTKLLWRGYHSIIKAVFVEAIVKLMERWMASTVYLSAESVDPEAADPSLSFVLLMVMQHHSCSTTAALNDSRMSSTSAVLKENVVFTNGRLMSLPSRASKFSRRKLQTTRWLSLDSSATF